MGPKAASSKGSKSLGGWAQSGPKTPALGAPRSGSTLGKAAPDTLA